MILALPAAILMEWLHLIAFQSRYNEPFLSSVANDATRPKVYLNWVLLDEQFNIAKDNFGNVIGNGYSGAQQVPVESYYLNGTSSPGTTLHTFTIDQSIRAAICIFT